MQCPNRLDDLRQPGSAETPIHAAIFISPRCWSQRACHTSGRHESALFSHTSGGDNAGDVPRNFRPQSSALSPASSGLWGVVCTASERPFPTYRRAAKETVHGALSRKLITSSLQLVRANALMAANLSPCCICHRVTHQVIKSFTPQARYTGTAGFSLSKRNARIAHRCVSSVFISFDSL